MLAGWALSLSRSAALTAHSAGHRNPQKTGQSERKGHRKPKVADKNVRLAVFAGVCLENVFRKTFPLECLLPLYNRLKRAFDGRY